ncbi:MAG: putative inorganic carbon transporter subunit DabA [Planctomycetaceae bacterium]
MGSPPPFPWSLAFCSHAQLLNSENRLEILSELNSQSSDSNDIPATPSRRGPHGYTIEEMANIVESGMRAIGLTRPERYSNIVLICGHGSGSVNNPHESAYNCGACSGSRGGPNTVPFPKWPTMSASVPS